MQLLRTNFGSFNKVLYFLILVFFVSGCKMYTAYTEIVNLQQENYFHEDKQGQPRLEYYDGIPILHLYGSSNEMGKQYGTIMQKQLESVEVIAMGLFSYKKVQSYLELAKEAEPHVPAYILDFIRGMSDASGVDYYSLLALNVVPKTTCSVLAVWGDATADGNLLMGRNADYNFKRVNRALGLIVVKHPEEGYSTVASSFLGMAGAFTGMNEKGVSYGNMLVHNGFEDDVITDGLPIQLLMQTAGERFSTAREMNDWLVEQQHMIPINVMCADKDEAIVAELGQHNYAIREGSEGVLASTNYFFSSGMFKEPELDDARFANLMLTAKKYYGEFNLEHLKEAMHAARQPRENLQCVLFEPAAMKMHVSMNRVPASAGPFTTFDINVLLDDTRSIASQNQVYTEQEAE